MKHVFFAGLLALTVAGCAGTKIEQGQPPAANQSAVQEVYKIGVGDGLSVAVWRNPELSVTVPVRPDGMISVPLVGDIQAAGKQPQELAQVLTSRLENFVRNPQVTVVVTNAASSEFLHRVRVTGAVGNPASLPFQKGMTIMDVVLVSGGVTQFADPNDAKLYRTTPEGTKVYAVKLKDILEKGDIKTNYPLQPGDIITVPERLF
jgi:polysaccharide biosynthesis/export protein